MAALSEPEDAQEITTLPDRVCYEAFWSDRKVYISAACQSALEWQWYSLASAILLERLEEACVLAETLLGTALQFSVGKLPKSKAFFKDHVRLLLQTNSDEVELWLPTHGHQTMRKNIKSVKQSNFRWDTVTAILNIANVHLSNDDLSRLEVGSIVLIPSSWSTQWRCFVDVPQIQTRLPALINIHDDAVELQSGKQDQMKVARLHRQGANFSVCLDESMSLNMAHLFENGSDSPSTESPTIQLPNSILQSTYCCRIENDGEGNRKFLANLFSVGDGFALRLLEGA